MRLNRAAGRAGLTLEQDAQRTLVGRVRFDHLRAATPLPRAEVEAVDPLPPNSVGVGIAEAVARAAAYGPGVLPTGIADAVLRLAFGRGGEVSAKENAVAGAAPAADDAQHLVDFLEARAARARRAEVRVDGELRARRGDFDPQRGPRLVRTPSPLLRREDRTPHYAVGDDRPAGQHGDPVAAPLKVERAGPGAAPRGKQDRGASAPRDRKRD